MHNSSVERVRQEGGGDLMNINLAGSNLKQYLNVNEDEAEHEDEPEIQDPEEEYEVE